MKINKTGFLGKFLAGRNTFLLLIFIVAGFVLFLNLQMPLVGEDYTLHAWGYNAAPLSDIERIQVIGQKVYYSAIMWSPRIGEAIATITSVFPKVVFDVLNVILFIWLIIVLFALGYGRFPNSREYSDVLTLFLIAFLIFTLFPLLGQVFFWKAGVTNHLWGVILILSFILPFRLNYSTKIEIKSSRNLILYVLFGFFAGLTVENASAVVLGFLLIYYFYSYHKNTIDRKFIFPLLSNAVGVSILLFSPGTTFRRNYYSQFGYDGNFSGIDMYFNRFERVHTDFLKTTWPLIVVFVVCLLIYILVRQQKNHEVEDGITNKKSTLIPLVIMFFMAYLSVLIMITIAYQSDQRRGFAFFWLIIIGQIAFFITEILLRIPKKVTLLVFAVLITLFVFQLVQIGSVYTQFNAENNARMEIIYSAIETGKKEIVLPAITIPDSRVLETREILSDLGIRIATYYGLDKVEILK